MLSSPKPTASWALIGTYDEDEHGPILAWELRRDPGVWAMRGRGTRKLNYYRGGVRYSTKREAIEAGRRDAARKAA